MLRSVAHAAGATVASVFIWAASGNFGAAATITQATVSTDLLAQKFNFEIVWSGAPDLSSDDFKYEILNPTTANNCCSPFAGWSGFAQANSDYNIIGDNNIISINLIDWTTRARTLLAAVPFTLNVSGNVLDFAVAFSLLNEPNGFVYELENYPNGSWDTRTLVGFSDGNAAQIPAVPLPSALPLFATGLGVMWLFGWRRKRKNAAILQ